MFRIIEAARGYLSASRRGQVSFSMRFSKPLQQNVTALVGAQMQTILRVDPKTRQVSYE